MATLQASVSRFRRPTRKQLQEWLLGYLFASPFIIGFLVFMAFPLVFMLWMSLHRWDLLTDPIFVGLDNYGKMFTDDRANLSLYNSAYYTVFAVPIQLVISFTLAMILTQKIRFRDFYRAGFYMPIIVPMVAWAVVWQRVLHPEFGILNEILGWFGVAPREWLFQPELAKPAFIFMSFWQIGRQMVIFIAGLGNIPDSLMDAAKVDGAGPVRRLFSIIIPMMTPFIFLNMIFAIVNSFQSFIPAKVMTDGGPQNATLFVVLNIWRQGFEFFNMGYAATLALELFVIVVTLTAIQFFISNRWVYYED